MPTTYTEPRSDAYTGLLAISLGAMVISAIILWLDFGAYPSKPATPAPPKLRAEQQQAPEAAPIIPPGTPAGTPAEKPAEKPAEDKKDKP